MESLKKERGLVARLLDSNTRLAQSIVATKCLCALGFESTSEHADLGDRRICVMTSQDAA